MPASDLATIAQVKAWLGADLGVASDPQLYGLITSVSRAIYSAMQRPDILPAAYAETRDGADNGVLLLKNFPVIAVSSVTVGVTTVPQAPSVNGYGWALESVDPNPPSRPANLYFRRGRFWRGQQNVQVAYSAGYQVSETLTVASAAAQASAPYGAWTTDQGVTYASTGAALAAVTGPPAQGQYALATNMPGGYVFNADDNGAAVIASYGYIPADLTQAAIEWIGARFKAQSYIGLRSKSLGGQETISYDTGAMPSFVMSAIQPLSKGDDVLSVSVAGRRELVARLEAMPSKVHDALLRKVTALDLVLEAKVKQKLSGQVLNVRTGALRRSIFGTVEDSATAVVGKVASSGDVKYAAIHEFGGTTRPHEILPDKASVLAFMIGGKTVFAKKVNHPGSKMPERSFLRSSLADMKTEIVEGLTSAVREGLRE